MSVPFWVSRFVSILLTYELPVTHCTRCLTPHGRLWPRDPVFVLLLFTPRKAQPSLALRTSPSPTSHCPITKKEKKRNLQEILTYSKSTENRLFSGNFLEKKKEKETCCLKSKFANFEHYTTRTHKTRELWNFHGWTSPNSGQAHPELKLDVSLSQSGCFPVPL